MYVSKNKANLIENTGYTSCVPSETIMPSSDPPGTISAPFTMAFRGRVLYEFVCACGANLNDGTFEILSNPLASCLVNHWMTTNCLPSESIKNAMHFPKYRLLFVERSPSEIRTFTQSCATTPWYRGIARKKTVCDPIISLKLI